MHLQPSPPPCQPPTKIPNIINTIISKKRPMWMVLDQKHHDMLTESLSCWVASVQVSHSSIVPFVELVRTVDSKLLPSSWLSTFGKIWRLLDWPVFHNKNFIMSCTLHLGKVTRSFVLGSLQRCSVLCCEIHLSGCRKRLHS